MSPDTSRWRSSSRYDYVDDLTAPEIGWEWLRRNEDYQRDYAEFSKMSSDPSPIIERAGEQWGLRFLCRPCSDCPRGNYLLVATRRYGVGDFRTRTAVNRWG